ncbi:uncharacterized protein LOC135139648 [Zophobas morio]|uniref:uncharacterized protein LOC135139648 n=1 Tax=Zophobas morio TaxID=2755281 RepID=UPI0030833064
MANCPISSATSKLNATGNSSLDFGKLLPQPTGIDFFRAFLDQLPPGFDITKILGNSTQSTQGFLEFLGQFDCFIRVIANINRARNGSCPPQEVIQSLIEHFRIPYSEGDVQKSIQNLLKTISGRLNGNGSGAGDLSSLNFSDLLPGIANSTTIQNALTNRTANQGFAIFNIISILSSLSGTIPADNSLPNFLGQLFSLFGTTNDTSVLTNLIPRYSDSRFGSVENIVTGFIKIFTTAIQVGAEIAAFFITFPIRFILLPFLAAVSDFFRGLCLPDLLRSQNIIDFFFRGLNVFIRVPISMFSAFIKGITTALEGVGELGGILEGLVNIGGSRTGGCSSIIGNLADREHVHARHSHHERHHSGKGKKHGNKEKKHEVKEKTHELHYKKREVKEKRAGVRERKVEHKKRELHHN